MENEAIFRFYEELNDFLPTRDRKRSKVYHFKGNPSVKDAIEAQNVPHTEVDLIVVNGDPVDFNYKLQKGDRVAVYPVFESFDISQLKEGGSRGLRQTRFILDVHLGKLAKLLRMAGFDTYYRNDLDDREIVERAAEEDRIVLTRDRGILKNKLVKKGYYVRSQNSARQLEEVLDRFQLRQSINFFTRCIVCNGMITRVGKKMIEKHLKPGTRKRFTVFFRCRGCGKIYWRGSHYQRMKSYYGSLLKNENSR